MQLGTAFCLFFFFKVTVDLGINLYYKFNIYFSRKL